MGDRRRDRLDVDGPDADELGEASRLGDSVSLPVHAEIRSATPTLVAVTALNDGVDDDEDALLEVPCSLPAGNDGARDFVARHNRCPRGGVIAIDDVQVSPADTAAVDLDDDFGRPRGRVVDGGQCHRSRTVGNGCPHLESSFRWSRPSARDVCLGSTGVAAVPASMARTKLNARSRSGRI